MKRSFLFFLIFFLSNCSFNDNSKFWTDDVNKKKIFKEKLREIIDKSNNIMFLTFDEYDYTYNNVLNDVKNTWLEAKNEPNPDSDTTLKHVFFRDKEL